jgi:hypothetical protein
MLLEILIVYYDILIYIENKLIPAGFFLIRLEKRAGGYIAGRL